MYAGFCFNIMAKILKIIFKSTLLNTMWLMKIFVKVRNNVARRPVLPGIEDNGMIRLICETNTTEAAGK